tara:strand:- start:119 stop:430 length:312 start_codon:yes stop_codon:yes gene_type:complete
MKKEINYSEFERWFFDHRPNNFSPAGLRSLYDYFEDYEEDTGESVEFDPIALCVEFTEYENLKEFKENYSADEYQEIDDINKLYDYTQVIPIENNESFIILDF